MSLGSEHAGTWGLWEGLSFNSEGDGPLRFCTGVT